MKHFTFYLLCSVCINMACAQLNQDAKDWQEDLLFLQKTVHQDYDFLFKKVEAAQFDAEIDKFYQAIPELEEHEIIVGFTRIVSLFQYGHTAIGLSGWYDRKPIDFDQMPFNLYHFNDGIYVQGVHKNYQNALGAKVLKVEGVAVEQALKAIRPVVPVENDQYFKAYGLTYLGTPQVLHAQRVTKELKNTVTLSLERDGNLFDVTFDPFEATKFPGQYSLIKEEGDWLDARDNGKDPHYLKNLERIYYYEYLPESKSLYVRHSQIQDDPEESIPEFYQRVFEFIEKNDVERMVLDVRLNGGGNNYKNKPIVTGIIGSEKINQVGKLYVLIGRRTFSACQNLVNELDNYTEAIFVGEPTSENVNFFGDNRRVELPNSKIPVRLSFAWWQDKPPWENADWLAPHLAVDMSFEEYRTNQDPVLEAALNFSDDNFIIDPVQHLTELFSAGKIDELEVEAKRMVNEPAYKFVDFNSQFNRAGYNLLGSGRVKEAIYVFELNTKLFPNSANAWDSLAEGFWKADQTEKAIQYYNKAIEMDPDGPTGDNARNMLKEIASGH